VIGTRRNIQNDIPIIGTYGANREGSGDMYYKAGNMMHIIRHIVNDDEKWRSVLRGLGKDFWHQTVTTQQVENYISQHAGVDLSKVFDQYLRTVKIPVLTYSVKGNEVTFWYENAADGFNMPLDVAVNGKVERIKPTTTRSTRTFAGPVTTFVVDRNYYVMTKEAQ
jgi:aminopeptidase N